MNEWQQQFLKRALAHYWLKLAEEKARFGVLAITDAMIEHNANRVIDPEYGAGAMWPDIAKQSGLHFHVDYVAEDPQSIYAILSREEVIRPMQLYLLWEISEKLRQWKDMPADDEDEFVADLIEDLASYNGPYKLDVPPEYLK